MSERSSFITEFIYCDKCFQSIKALTHDNIQYKYWDIAQVKDYPILAGKIGAVGPGGELNTLLNILKEENIKPCHSIRCYILADSGAEYSYALIIDTDGQLDFDIPQGE